MTSPDFQLNPKISFFLRSNSSWVSKPFANRSPSNSMSEILLGAILALIEGETTLCVVVKFPVDDAKGSGSMEFEKKLITKVTTNNTVLRTRIIPANRVNSKEPKYGQPISTRKRYNVDSLLEFIQYAE